MELSSLHLDRKDFQLVLGLFLIDISLTIPGILSGTGSEMSPFYQPFTGSITLMAAGAALYVLMLETFNLFLHGRKRTVLAATAAGMHIWGISSWLLLLAEIGGSGPLYIQFVVVSLASACSYSLLEMKGWLY